MLVNTGIHWDKKVDIVIVGFGGAGGVSAITAHDLNSEVLIVEKQSEKDHHTNTSMSGGGFIAVNDISKAITYMKGLYKISDELTWTSENILAIWAEYCFQNTKWLASLGLKTNLNTVGGEHRILDGFDAIEIFNPPDHGKDLHRILLKNVKSRGIEVFYQCPAEKLIVNNSGRVIGIRVNKNGECYYIKASKAVILTSGGFEFDEELKLNNLRIYPTYFTGSPSNTGDGIRMAQDVGASLWHMNCCSARLVAKFPEFLNGFNMDYGGSGDFRGKYSKEGWPNPFIIVNRNGKRFTNDGELKGHSLYYELAAYDTQRLEFPCAPCYFVFDVNRLNSVPLRLRREATGLRPYIWSDNNQVELKKGWIIQGDTISDLAANAGMDPDTLEKTITKYNSYCAQGQDPEFHRPVRHLKPVKDGPFFAVRLWPGGPNTQGGPRRNFKSQVMNGDNTPIPGLYSAGELGSIYGMIYPAAGGNIAECIAFGRIAGENAASETPVV
jgi:succinate dehydrogenase/fumarate reductase flavoprotein subunit